MGSSTEAIWLNMEAAFAPPLGNSCSDTATRNIDRLAFILSMPFSAYLIQAFIKMQQAPGAFDF
jgi:hypothetical protein